MYSEEWIEEKMHFDRDDAYCVWKSNATNGKCGNSKAECDRCMKEYEQMLYCDLYGDDCEDCPRYGDDCDGDPDRDSSETL